MPGWGLVAAEAVVVLGARQFLVASAHLISPLFLPAPLSILSGLRAMAASGELAYHVGYSLADYAAGYAIAVALGVVLGLAVGGVAPVHRLAAPILWSIYATPWLAYRPLSVIWFGFGAAPVVFLVVITSTFPVLFNTAAGVGSVRPSWIHAARAFGAGRLAVYRKVVLPATVPFVLGGMRQSVVMAMVGLLVAEMTGSSRGIGALITLKTHSYQTPEAYGAIVVAVLVTAAASRLLGLGARLLAPWAA